MRIIKSLENFKKIFEDDKSTQSTQIQTQVKPEQAKPTQSQNTVQGQQRPENKEYYYKGKKIEGVVKDGKLVSKAGNIKLEDVKEFGQKINKIQEIKPYFYYIQNIDNINYRVVKVVGVKDNVVKIVFQKNNEEIAEDVEFNKIKLFNTNPEKQDEKGYAQSKRTKDDSQSEEKSTIKAKIEKSKNIEDLPKDEINKVLKAGENDQKTKVKIINKDGKEVEMSLADAIKQLRSEMSTQKSNESYNQGKYKIFEEAEPIEYNSVKNIWRGFFEEWDKKETMTLSQREVDEMDKLIGSGKDKLSLDVSKRPDPIVNITKIYTRAHELYYTDIIPSGRPKGRVSVKTAREYIQLGKPSYPIDPEDPIKGGPYAVKVLFRKWRNGVLTILQDQSYRKILSNVDFVVPGARDKFNPEGTSSAEPKESGYSSKDERGLKRGESTGQILFEYMTDMLNPKKLDDFEGLQSELLNKYFGIDRKKADVGEIKPTTSGKGKTTKASNIDEEYLKWLGFENFQKFMDGIIDNHFRTGNIVLIHFVENNKRYMMIGEIERNLPASKKLEFSSVEFVNLSENSKIVGRIDPTYTVGKIKPTNRTEIVTSSGNMEAEITIDPSNKNKFKLKITKNAPTIFSAEKEYDVIQEEIDMSENAHIKDSKTSARILQKYENGNYKNFVKS